MSDLNPRITLDASHMKLPLIFVQGFIRAVFAHASRVQITSLTYAGHSPESSPHGFGSRRDNGREVSFLEDY